MAETEQPPSLGGDLSVELLRPGGARKSRPDPGLEGHRRRITYFMLLRLLLLTAFLLFTVTTVWFDAEHDVRTRDTVIWIIIGGGFLLTITSSWMLRQREGVRLRRKQLERIAAFQGATDVVFASTAVWLTGGVLSGLVFLFPIAVLGAAMMGDRRQIWLTAATCGAFFGLVSLAQFLDWIHLGLGAGEVVTPQTLLIALLRATGAIGAIALLSSRLNTQLLVSESHVEGLLTLNENIVRSLTSGLLTVDHTGRVLFINPTGRELLLRNDVLAGLDCEEVLPGLAKHLADSGVHDHRFELSHERPDGRTINIGLSCSPLLDEEGSFLGHVVNFRDVTELREMERVLRRSERLAALGGLAASVAHEVRNPLAAISGCAELLDTVDANDEDRRLIRVIRRESVRLNEIVTELLDYTRPRKLERAPVDLCQALRELAEAFEADPQNAAIDLALELPPAPVHAELDSSQITQVLWNLVRNGAQAMAHEGRLELGVVASLEFVHIHVRDQGRGIPDKDLEHIFEPFFSTKDGGSGIGLALVQRIVEDHGGDIEVYSKVGEGTRFMVNLPKLG